MNQIVPIRGGDNAATPPHHSWTIKLMEKTIARLTGAINQMRLQTKAVSPRGVIRIDKRIRQLAFCASLICPGILLLIVFREGSPRFLSASGITVVAGSSFLIVLSVIQYLPSGIDKISRLLSLRSLTVVMLQFLVLPQVMLSSQLLSITIWDGCRLLSLPKAARLLGGLVAAEIIVTYLGLQIPLAAWRDASFTLLCGLWISAILAGLVGYMLQLRWIEAQRKNMLLDRHRQSMTSLAKTIIDLQDYAVQAEDFAIRKQREYVARERRRCERSKL